MRLRRTIAGALVLALLVVGVSVVRGRQGERATPSRAVAAKASVPTRTPTVNRTPEEDGSPHTETPAANATAVPQHGNGKISVLAVPPARNTAPGRVVTYTVEAEGGLGEDPAILAATVETVLLDPRGWQKVDGVRFVNVTPEQAAKGAKVDIRVTLASPGLTDRLCAPMRTLSQVSCWNGERSVLNYRRWALGDDSYGPNVALYRVYQINHEVGHGLGHQHRDCPGRGKRAPVMVQQTLDLGGCVPWPYPSGA